MRRVAAGKPPLLTRASAVAPYKPALPPLHITSAALIKPMRNSACSMTSGGIGPSEFCKPGGSFLPGRTASCSPLRSWCSLGSGDPMWKDCNSSSAWPRGDILELVAGLNNGSCRPASGGWPGPIPK